MKPKTTRWTVIAGVLIAAVIALAQAALRQPNAAPTSPSRSAPALPSSSAPSPTIPESPGKSSPFGGEKAVLDAIRTRSLGVLVQVEAEVFRILPDDREGAEHQRFLVELRGGQSLLVAHNTDLAPRVPVKAGDRVVIAGQYEWNEQGGVLHWTHHDPGKRRPGGWIEHAGKKYQ